MGLGPLRWKQMRRRNDPGRPWVLGHESRVLQHFSFRFSGAALSSLVLYFEWENFSLEDTLLYTFVLGWLLYFNLFQYDPPTYTCFILVKSHIFLGLK